MAGGPRLESLTGLRFYAAALVLVCHLPVFFEVPGLVDDAGRAGFLGVEFFFVLSGFVLMWSMSGELRARRFYWRRFARVWPAFALVTLLVALVPFPVPRAADASALPANLLLLNGWTWDESILPPGWSLSAEAFFYALFPFIAPRLARHRRTAALIVAAMTGWTACALVLVADERTLFLFLTYKLPLYRLGEFVLGMLLADAIRRGWRPDIRLGTAIAGAALGYVGASSLELPMPVTGLVMLGPLCLLVAAVAVADLEGGTRLGRGWHERLGRWSYALYLVHWPVFAAIAATGLHGAAAPALAVGASIAAAGLLFCVVERPADRWLRGRERRPGPSMRPGLPEGTLAPAGHRSG